MIPFSSLRVLFATSNSPGAHVRLGGAIHDRHDLTRVSAHRSAKVKEQTAPIQDL